MANPDPEILPEDIKSVRDDAIIATGRSDYPNQVNNVLGFPYIFRGALDVRARNVNEDMKLAVLMRWLIWHAKMFQKKSLQLIMGTALNMVQIILFLRHLIRA